MVESQEYTFSELKENFRSIVAVLWQAEKCIETEEVTENSASTHAKGVYCALQFRRLINNVEPKISACVQAQDWQLFTCFSWLNSELLTKQPFRDAMLEVLKAKDSGAKTAMLFKSLLRNLASLAERMLHIKGLSMSEVHFSTIALIKLNRLLELKNFETSYDNQYEEFGIYNRSSEKLDVRIENTPPQRTLPTASVNKSLVMEDIDRMEKYLKTLKKNLCALEILFQVTSENSLRYAQLWAEVFDEDQRSFGVKNYVFKCEKELQECGPFSKKLVVMTKYVEEFLLLVQGLKEKKIEGAAPVETLQLILQHVTAASNLTIAFMIHITAQRMYDLAGKESVQRYQKARAKETSLSAGSEPEIYRSHSRMAKSMRFVSQVAANLTTSTKKTIRGSTKKREAENRIPNQAAGTGKMHEDIVLEYFEAIRFTSVLMTNKEPNN